MDIVFKQAKTEKEIKKIYDHTIDAFSDSPDFNWTYEEIRSEVKTGWNLYGAYHQGEVIAALFFKEDGDRLLTKNTAIKMGHHGSGYSHDIKSFFEELGLELGKSEIYHYCRIDNFRMYSLNESHGYKKIGHLQDNPQIVEWVRSLKEASPRVNKKVG